MCVCVWGGDFFYSWWGGGGGGWEGGGGGGGREISSIDICIPNINVVLDIILDEEHLP